MFLFITDHGINDSILLQIVAESICTYSQKDESVPCLALGIMYLLRIKNVLALFEKKQRKSVYCDFWPHISFCQLPTGSFFHSLAWPVLKASYKFLIPFSKLTALTLPFLLAFFLNVHQSRLLSLAAFWWKLLPSGPTSTCKAWFKSP